MAKLDECLELLEDAGIRATSNRILVLGAIMDAEGPVSMKDIERMVPSLDKSSIFRSLTVMKDNDLLHALDGGPEGVLYEVCHGHHDDVHDDEHVHFHCDVCGRTYCLEHIKVPRFELPEGYQVRQNEHIVKGVCPSCSAKRR